MKGKPVLSIGIIFKNEIRCLERCLSSFDGLRKRVPCQLVAADTGSDDGSREVAERYADVLIDFPWINDFSAARNAVVDRCEGEWLFFVDADEWLDEDFSELEAFLKNPKYGKGYLACTVVVRNYTSYDLRGDYGDFMAARMLRMSTGIRYEGAIHEHWNQGVGAMLGMGKTILHHDGYVGLEREEGSEKRKRNLAPLRKKLEADPDNLLTLLQCVESSVGYELEGYIRRSIRAVEERRAYWESFGPPLFRYAVSLAKASELPEYHDWAARARELFPESLYIRVDINYYEFTSAINVKNYEDAIPLGEAYLQAMEDYRTRHFDAADLAVSSVSMVAPDREDEVRIHLANAYFYTKAPEKCVQLLQTTPVQRLSAENIKNYFGMLLNVYAQSEINTSAAIAELWRKISASGENSEQVQAVLTVAAGIFPQRYREAETAHGFHHAYRALLPLAGKCGPGIAAQVLDARTVSEMHDALLALTDWDQISIHALAHALKQGLPFPMEEKPLRQEDAARLAKRLTAAGDTICCLTAALAPSRWRSDPAYLNWARALVITTVQTYPWQRPTLGAEHAMAMARTFAQVEADFLPFYYGPGVLTEENLFLLPPIHRFGWYWVQAFSALETGDAIGYTQLLRKALISCEGMDAMVEFLLNNTPALQVPPPGPELPALAEQVRTMLAAYDPDDPAVMALKKSPVYQRVAHLIEEDGI